MRRQLAVLVAATTSLVLLALFVPVYLLLREQAEQRAISTATWEAQSIAQLGDQLGSDSLPPSGRTTIFLPNGSTVGAAAPRTESIELAFTGRAFVAEVGDDIEVLVPYRSSESGTSVVRVLVTEENLHAGVTRTLLVLAGIVLLIFVIGIALADRLGRRLVLSVTELASVADRLARGDSSARVLPSGPREIQQVGAELNRLADRIAALLSSERQEVADLAHRLRTPLTALRLEAEGVRAPAEAARLSASVDGLTRQVDELIRTARRPVREGPTPRADLVHVTAERLTFWEALAEDTGRELVGALPATEVPVPVSPDDLATAIDALLDNAFTHTADGIPIHLHVSTDRVVRIDDGGQGFADETDRTGRGTTEIGSTGLGLDITRRTVEAAGGWMDIGSSPLGGARVELHFGPQDG